MVVWTKRSDGSTVWSSRNVSTSASWTVATRPSSPFDGQTGKNTDYDGLEVYVTSQSGWMILTGRWTTATRPTTTDIISGSKGYNTDTGMGEELWDGTNWRLL